ncbi:MAG: preprotein translocase subunit YajC [Candidatus Omnitrophica bacterium]|nr:preprotein translocase subunit YajC [Candidatus Omnitrophota bacterium]
MMVLAFAQNAETQAAVPQQSPIMSFVPIILIFAIFYFVLIRPQKKSQREHVMMLDALKKNDEVTTSGGIFGTIVNIQNDVVTLRVDDNTRIKVEKGFISKIRRSPGALEEAK